MPNDVSVKSMHEKTEDLLYAMLWAGNMLSRPTFRNLTEGYESWAYRNGLLQQLTRLEAVSLIETKASQQERTYRLTRAGLLVAIGGRNPDERWHRPWDGRWRLALFDLPIFRNSYRNDLRHILKARGFGCLQRSVWITPDTLEAIKELMGDGEVNVNTLTFFEGRPCANESDEAIVAAAWNFRKINDRYAYHLEILASRPTKPLRDLASIRTFQSWIKSEREAWLDAFTLDPLLPKALLPKDYLGVQAWRRKQEVMSKAAKQIQGFQLLSIKN